MLLECSGESFDPRDVPEIKELWDSTRRGETRARAALRTAAGDVRDNSIIRLNIDVVCGSRISRTKILRGKLRLHGGRKSLENGRERKDPNIIELRVQPREIFYSAPRVVIRIQTATSISITIGTRVEVIEIEGNNVVRSSGDRLNHNAQRSSSSIISPREGTLASAHARAAYARKCIQITRMAAKCLAVVKNGWWPGDRNIAERHGRGMRRRFPE